MKPIIVISISIIRASIGGCCCSYGNFFVCFGLNATNMSYPWRVLLRNEPDRTRSEFDSPNETISSHFYSRHVHNTADAPSGNVVRINRHRLSTYLFNAALSVFQ